MEHLPPDNQRGPKQSAIECDRKQVKSKPTEHKRRGRKSGVRSTYQGEDKETSLKKDRSYWKTKTYGGTKQPYSE